LIFPDPESLIRRSPASAPLLDAVKDRKTRGAVKSVLDRLTGGGLKPAAPDRLRPLRPRRRSLTDGWHGNDRSYSGAAPTVKEPQSF
jgi:hypothetical protein